MVVNCRNILKLPFCSEIKLIAGRGGQNRIVKWFHYMEDPGYSNYLKGGELVLTTGIFLKNDMDMYMEFVDELYQAGVAGLIINLSPYTTQIPQEIIQMGDDLEFPIFEMPAELHIIDVSQSICRAIVNAATEQNKKERLLLDLIYSKNGLTDKKISKIKELGFREGCMYRVMTIFLEEDEEVLRNEGQMIIESISMDVNQLFYIVQTNNIVFVFPTEDDKSAIELANVIYDFLAAKYEDRNPRIGIGSAFCDFADFRTSYEQSQRAIELLYHDMAKHILNYSEMDFYCLLYEIENRNRLSAIYQKILNPLLVSDKETGSELVATLETFLKENGNLIHTSEKLFIHVNTLRYRINKIEQMLGIDTHCYTDLFRLGMAIQIKNFLNAESVS